MQNTAVAILYTNNKKSEMEIKKSVPFTVASKKKKLRSNFFFNFYFYFILLYSTVLVLPYIDMNPPRVYINLFILIGG